MQRGRPAQTERGTSARQDSVPEAGIAAVRKLPRSVGHAQGHNGQAQEEWPVDMWRVWQCGTVPYPHSTVEKERAVLKVADCHFSYREPHCRPPKVAPTLAFWGAYAAGARERDGRLPGIGPSRKWGALKRLREGGYVREFARRARWPFAMRSAKAATRDGRLPGTRPARWPFARHPASEMAVCQASGQL